MNGWSSDAPSASAVVRLAASVIDRSSSSMSRGSNGCRNEE
jgi:hypothetical protein